MTWTIYDPTTGITTSRVRNPNQLVGRPHVPGDWQPGRWYVVRGQPRELPPHPDSADHIVWQWDLATESWSVDLPRTEQRAREQRERLFAFVDKVSPMWWAAMTPAQQSEATAYRQAILDITRQPGWPAMIEWPLKPAWL